MKSLSEGEHATPQAGLIPPILSRYMIYDLDISPAVFEHALEFARLPLNDIYGRKEEFVKSTKEIQLAQWICILLAHQKSSQEDLQHIAEVLNLSDSIFFKGAILTNRTDILSKINTTDNNEIEIAVCENRFQLFRLATELKHYDLLKILCDILPDKKEAMISVYNYAPLRTVVEQGSLEAFQWLTEQISEISLTKIFSSSGHLILDSALKQGYLHILDWIKNKITPNDLDEIAMDMQYIFRNAAESGQISSMEWVIEHISPSILNKRKNDRVVAFSAAAMKGHVEVLQYLKEHYPDEVDKMFNPGHNEGFGESPFSLAVSSNKIKVLEWFQKIKLR
ncbi:ankyrin repeat domain-containing protein [Legionella norrlandica]|uniref:ankyrin repeat domain-containing protein n=1 Tax=Legionella norrlandica TaxID=1498499 RepID=UPI00056A002E|nr:ankyrin repeat domain-containing protein [Legionella norrlandica]